MDPFTLLLSGLCIAFIYMFYLRIALSSFRRLGGIDDFFIYNKRLREASVFSSTFAAEMSLATVFIAFMTLAPIFGISLFWSILTFVSGQVVLWCLIPRIKRLVLHGETLQTFLGSAYRSSSLRKVASIISVVGFIGLFSTEIVVGANLFSALFSNDAVYWSVLILVSFLVVFYTSLGGFRSVIITDRIQTLGTMLAIIVLALAAFSVGGNANGQIIKPSLLQQTALPWLLIFNFVIINVFYPVCDMAAWQRIAAALDVPVARKGFALAVVMFLVSWSAILFSALALADNSSKDIAGGIVVSLGELSRLSVFDSILASIALAGLAAAMLSTGDTFLIAASQSLSMDIKFPAFFDQRRTIAPDAVGASIDAPIDFAYKNEVYAGIESSAIIAWSRRSIFVMAAIGITLASILAKGGFAVADFVFVVYGSTVCLLPSIITAFILGDSAFMARLGKVAMLSVIVGLLSGWIYGITVVVFAGLPSVLDFVTKAAPFPGGPSAYNSPSVALLVSGAIFLIHGLLVYVFGGRSR